MSVDDADAFVASAVVHEVRRPLVDEDVVVFIDFKDEKMHEDTFIAAMKWDTVRVVRASMRVSDIVVARVQLIDEDADAVSSAVFDDEVRLRASELPPSVLLSDATALSYAVVVAVTRKPLERLAREAAADATVPLASLNDVAVFVDFHEDNTRREESFVSALSSVTVEGMEARRVHVAHLESADVVVARVVQRTAATAAADDIFDENVTLRGGAKATTLLADPVATTWAPIEAGERKTKTDLATSMRVKSNVPGEQHLSSQMARLLTFCEVTLARPRLLIEGYMPHALTRQPINAMNEDAIHSYLARRDFADGISIVQTANIEDTARLILKDARYIQRERIAPSAWMRLPRATSEPRLSVRKSDNYDTRRYYVSVLMAVPQMSEARAKVIADTFPSIPALVRALAREPTHKARLALIAPLKAGTRKLGPVLAERVVAIYGPDVDAESSTDDEDEEEVKVSSSSSSSSSATPAATRRRPLALATPSVATGDPNEVPIPRRRAAVGVFKRPVAAASDDDDDDDDDDDFVASESDSESGLVSDSDSRSPVKAPVRRRAVKASKKLFE